MDKQIFTTFAENAKSAGIEEYIIRYEGGNRIARINGKTSIVVQKDECIYIVQLTSNYAKEGGILEFVCLDYDDIDDVKIDDLTFEEAIKTAEAFGITLEEEFLKNIPVRMDIKPGTANLATMKEVVEKEDGTKEEKLVMPKGMSGYVV